MKNEEEPLIILILKSIFFLVITYFSYLLVFRRVNYIFLDNINLLIHEAGHLIFYVFGDFLQTLGGSINQLLIPVVFSFYFLRRRDIFAFSFSLFWIGDNFINISYYIIDAKHQVLPLIGAGTHDWVKILTRTGQLENYEIIGNSVFYLGALVIVISFIVSLFYLVNGFTRPLSE